MKKIAIVVVTFIFFTSSNAQDANKFRVGLDLGIVPAKKGFGLAFFLEPKYNVKENMNIGLRLGSTAIIKNTNTSSNPISGSLEGIGSYTGTFDYYFPNGDNFVPYIGGGVGYNQIVNVVLTDIGNQDNVNKIPNSNVIGGLIRGGFELGKFRLGLEYNFLPKTTAYTIAGSKLSDVSNSYLALNLGFYIGGGKWKRQNQVYNC